MALPRAAARVRQDSWDDLWPDPICLFGLPRYANEFAAARRSVAAMRQGRAIPMARIGLVPKPNGLMRPAHILTLESRLYYQALVDSFMYDIDRRIAAKSHVFGYRPLAPRSTSSPFGLGLHQWKRFRDQLRREVESHSYGALVRTDLAAFFERIPHGGLEERLTSLGIGTALARELRTFLKGTMGQSFGLPQGPDPSGVLASAYLDPLDKAMVAAGYGYVRYVDDIVILARNYTDARKALRLLETECRRLDLIVQSAKTEVFVGDAAMMAAVGDDDEIAGVDYIVKRRKQPEAVFVVRKAWRKAARPSSKPSRRLIKYLLGRLTDNADPTALHWCLARLGELDYLAPTLSRYLALFASKAPVQAAVATHLASEQNISEWEEMSLLRAMLSARSVNRALLDRSRLVVGDRNLGLEVRQFALLLLGRHGDGTDHDFVARECLDNELLARAALLALHGATPHVRGRAYSNIRSRYPVLAGQADAIRSLSSPRWPLFR